MRTLHIIDLSLKASDTFMNRYFFVGFLPQQNSSNLLFVCLLAHFMNQLTNLMKLSECMPIVFVSSRWPLTVSFTDELKLDPAGSNSLL